MDLITLLQEKEVSSKTEKLEELEKALKKNVESSNQYRKEYNSAREQKLSLESELQQIEQQERRAINLSRDIDIENKKVNYQIEVLKKELAANARNIKRTKAMKERPTFYAALQARLIRLQEEFIDGGIEFKEPHIFMRELKHDIEKGRINEYTVFIRGAYGRYNQFIENIATSMVDGVSVSPKELLEVNAYLDSFLKHDTMLSKWS